MFIDTHLHLNSENYPDPLSIIEKANLVGVNKFVTIGTKYEEFPEILNLTNHPQVFGTLGIYPTYDNHLHPEELISYIERNLTSKIVGIGECGFNQPFATFERNLLQQEEIFRRQIELANQLKLPLVIHTRNSDSETIRVLESYKNTNIKGVIHCFVSDYNFAKRALDLGFYLSFNGIITYKSGNSIYETIQKMPLDKIVLETDAPYLPPEGYRNTHNEPSLLPIIAEKVAEVRNIPLEKLKEQIYKNSLELFDKIAV